MINKLKSALFSGTARDTFYIFGGNSASAGFGLLFTLIAAKVLSLSDFGIFSAVNNLIMISSSLSDAGTSSGSLKFIALAEANKKTFESRRYTKAAFILRFLISAFFSSTLFIFAPFVAKRLLSNSDLTMAWWAGIINLLIFVWLFTPYVLRARSKFFQSALVDGSLGLGRFLIMLVFYFLGVVSLQNTLLVFLLGVVASTFLSFYFMGSDFLFVSTGKKVYKKLISFSGWLGVNNVVSSISGRLDLSMLAAMTTPETTAVYSLSSRFALFIVVLTGSFSAVISTRFASFNDRQKEKKYLIKTALGIVPISLLVVFWVLAARPFFTIPFGDKYLDSIPVFQLLALSYIPFLFTSPAVSAIIYALKKPIYVGYFSFFQLAQVFLVNLWAIPRYGVYGPILSLFILNIILVGFTWGIVVRYYWMGGKSKV